MRRPPTPFASIALSSPESIVARPFPYEPMVMLLARMCSDPLNVEPPARRSVSPLWRSLARFSVRHARVRDVPEFVSLPDGATGADPGDGSAPDTASPTADGATLPPDVDGASPQALQSAAHKTMIASVANPTLQRYVGMRLDDVAREMHEGIGDALLDVVEADHANTTQVVFVKSEADVRAILCAPWVALGSDSGAQAVDGPFAHVGTHPRAFGAAARIVGPYARDLHVFSLEEAVRRLTSLPARRVGLLSIVRLFLSDSRAVDRGISVVKKSHPDAVEILPAVVAAKVAGIEPNEAGALIRYRRRGQSEIRTMQVGAIVDCTGIVKDPLASANPAVRSLFERGLARVDPLHIGIETAADGAILNQDGAPSRRLFAVGPLTRAAFWEIIAIPDIRNQCAELAAKLAHVDEASLAELIAARSA